MDDGVKSYIKSFSSNIKKTHGHVSEIFINNPISTKSMLDASIGNEIELINLSNKGILDFMHREDFNNLFG